MKRISWQVCLAIAMIGLSSALYVLNFELVRDARAVLSNLLGNIAAQPIYILVVILLVQEWMNRQERSTRLQKMNMVIGAFFSQTGTDLIRLLACFDSKSEDLQRLLVVDDHWTLTQFRQAGTEIGRFDFGISNERGDLPGLARYLREHWDSVLRLLENPTLLEHERFTDTLWAITHLAEELSAREHLDELPESDHRNVTNDMKRAYALLLQEWLFYLRHLQLNYPYLFSLAMRTNPFDSKACPEVKA